jgi:hypothetical protein
VTVEPVTTFAPISSFPVSAGIGSFNASFAEIWLPSVLAYHVASEVWIQFYNFLITKPIPPITPACFESGSSSCIAYFFTGGESKMYPQISEISDFQSADAFSIVGEPCIQGDYWNVAPGEDLTTGNCETWGSSIEAIAICVTFSAFNSSNLIAGIYSNNGTTNGSNGCVSGFYRESRTMSQRYFVEVVRSDFHLLCFYPKNSKYILLSIERQLADNRKRIGSLAAKHSTHRSSIRPRSILWRCTLGAKSDVHHAVAAKLCFQYRTPFAEPY